MACKVKKRNKKFNIHKYYYFFKGKQIEFIQDYSIKMTYIPALQSHPYLEWAETLQMWRIGGGDCCLCGASRYWTKCELAISAMLCHSCIELGSKKHIITVDMVIEIRSASNLDCHPTKRGQFSFAVDTKILKIIPWGLSVARCIGKETQLVQF